MSTSVSTESPPMLADLLSDLGDISPSRIVLNPAPGMATEADLERLLRGDHLYELVDGTLVEKPMGYRESLLAMWIGHLLATYLDSNKIGELSGPDGTMRLMPGLVRIPDVASVHRDKFPGGQVPIEPIPDLAPDLAIEVLSEINTPGEMRRKVRDYFQAGCALVWLVDPATRSVAVYTGPDATRTVTEADTLDGGTLLPGLSLPVRRVFERLPAPAPRRATKRKKG